MSFRWRTLKGECGSASLLILTVSIALIIAIGFAVDGTRKAQAYSDATAIAEEAARVGGQALRVHALAVGEDADVTPDVAAAEAHKYLTTSGAAGTVTVQNGRIIVDTTITKPTIFLGMVGIPEISAHGHGTAILVSAG